MNDYSKITALYSRLSVGDEDRDGGERAITDRAAGLFNAYHHRPVLDFYESDKLEVVFFTLLPPTSTLDTTLLF